MYKFHLWPLIIQFLRRSHLINFVLLERRRHRLNLLSTLPLESRERKSRFLGAIYLTNFRHWAWDHTHFSSWLGTLYHRHSWQSWRPGCFSLSNPREKLVARMEKKMYQQVVPEINIIYNLPLQTSQKEQNIPHRGTSGSNPWHGYFWMGSGSAVCKFDSRFHPCNKNEDKTLELARWCFSVWAERARPCLHVILKDSFWNCKDINLTILTMVTLVIALCLKCHPSPVLQCQLNFPCASDKIFHSWLTLLREKRSKRQGQGSSLWMSPLENGVYLIKTESFLQRFLSDIKRIS